MGYGVWRGGVGNLHTIPSEACRLNARKCRPVLIRGGKL